MFTPNVFEDYTYKATMTTFYEDGTKEVKSLELTEAHLGSLEITARLCSAQCSITFDGFQYHITFDFRKV